jgi:hypothetical protein
MMVRPTGSHASRSSGRADTAAIVQILPSECYERLFELTRAMAFQRAVFEPERGGMIRHDLLISGTDAYGLAQMLRSSIPGYRTHWQHLQSGDHELNGDLDSRIGYARAILDRKIPFWRE